MPEGHGSRFSHLREEAITALVVHRGDIDAAAAQLGISPRTLRRWINKPGMRKELNRWRNAQMEGQLTELTRLTPKAIATLDRIMSSGKKEADQARAARAVLEFQERASDHKRDERIEKLEQQVAALQQQKGNNLNVIVTQKSMDAFLDRCRAVANGVTPEVIEHESEETGSEEIKANPRAFLDFVEDSRPAAPQEPKPGGNTSDGALPPTPAANGGTEQ